MTPAYRCRMGPPRREVFVHRDRGPRSDPGRPPTASPSRTASSADASARSQSTRGCSSVRVAMNATVTAMSGRETIANATARMVGPPGRCQGSSRQARAGWLDPAARARATRTAAPVSSAGQQARATGARRRPSRPGLRPTRPDRATKSAEMARRALRCPPHGHIDHRRSSGSVRPLRDCPDLSTDAAGSVGERPSSGDPAHRTGDSAGPDSGCDR
jgi:hypothetical protein